MVRIEIHRIRAAEAARPVGKAVVPPPVVEIPTAPPPPTPAPDPGPITGPAGQPPLPPA